MLRPGDGCCVVCGSMQRRGCVLDDGCVTEKLVTSSESAVDSNNLLDVIHPAATYITMLQAAKAMPYTECLSLEVPTTKLHAGHQARAQLLPIHKGLQRTLTQRILPQLL